MGLKAEGAAQAYTLLGGLVLAIMGFNMIAAGVANIADINGLLDVVLGIALILMVILSLDACGFVYWKVQKSGVLLAIFGFAAMVIVARNLPLDIMAWLTDIGLLAGFMILIAGLLLIFRK
jgi:hypothetical protein